MLLCFCVLLTATAHKQGGYSTYICAVLKRLLLCRGRAGADKQMRAELLEVQKCYAELVKACRWVCLDLTQLPLALHLRAFCVRLQSML